MKNIKLVKILLVPLSISWIAYTVHGYKTKNQTLLAAENHLKLEKVFIIFRHGARTFTTDLTDVDDIPNIEPAHWDQQVLLKTLPFADIPISLTTNDRSDPNILLTEEEYRKRGALNGGCLTGQLTTVGQQDAYELGEWIGKTYIQQHQLVSPTFNQDELYIRSSKVGRTLLSAKCVLSGIYGKKNIKVAPSIITRCYTKDYIFPNWGNCKDITEWKDFLTADLSTNFPEHKAMAKEIRNLLGMDKRNKPIHFVALLDFIHCRKKHGMFVPSFLIEREETITNYAAQLQGRIIIGNNRVVGLRRSIGQLVDEVCNKIESSSESMYLYSAHDTTLVALLMVLDQWDDDWPTYSASMCFEVHTNKDNEKFVRVLYEREPLYLDNENPNNQYVPLDSFFEKVSKYRITDWAAACGNTLEETKAK